MGNEKKRKIEVYEADRVCIMYSLAAHSKEFIVVELGNIDWLVLNIGFKH